MDNLPGISSVGSSTLGFPTPSTSTINAPSATSSLLRNFRQNLDLTRGQTPSHDTSGLFKSACSVDLLFLIDCTNSMMPYIEAAKDQVQSIVYETKHGFLDEALVRVAVVTYKDHNLGPNVDLLDFTSSTTEVESFLNNIKTQWGDDYPENVLGGISQAINASWQQKTRCLVHIGDAPPHGEHFSGLQDRYWCIGSEPHGLTYEPLLRQLVQLNINYAFVRITQQTDRMAWLFSEVYRESQAQISLHRANDHQMLFTGQKSVKSRVENTLKFEEMELGTSFDALRHLVVNSVTSSVSRTASRLKTPIGTSRAKRSGRTVLAAVHEDETDYQHLPRRLPLDKDKPRWFGYDWFDRVLDVDGYCLEATQHGADALEDFMTETDHTRVETIQLQVHARSIPFDEGALRVASYARTTASTDKFVVKTFKKQGQGLAHFAEEMQGRNLCKAFALEFSALVDPIYSLDFVVATVLMPKTQDASSADSILLEPFIDGQYTKYNTNAGFVCSDKPKDPCSVAAQAFSHFTFERSRGRLLVVDLQGVGNLLTDPAIHTRDEESFKLFDTNLHTAGFKFFFSTHQCNDLCRHLQLRSNKQMLIDGDGAMDFRRDWPKPRATVYCSNKLCRRILHKLLATSGTSSSPFSDPDFPGYEWCASCRPQLRASMTSRLCDGGTRPGSALLHGFRISRFFYESQGILTLPTRCPEHELRQRERQR